jgi:predicted permease
MNMGADVGYALRSLWRSPGFAAIAILTLALAVGANTAIFTVVNALLLRALPVQEPHQLATISSDYAISRGFKAGLGWSRPMWDAFAARADAFAGAFVWSPDRFNLSRGGGEVQPVDVLHASAGFFSTLGVRPLAGRVFTPADDVAGGGADGPVAVISYRMWQRHFGGDPAAIGSALVLEGVRFAIVGITPPEFRGLEIGQGFDAVIPLATEPLLRRDGKSRFDNFLLIVMLRLKPEQSLESGTAIVRAIQPHLPGYGKGPKFVHEPFTLLPAAEGTSGYGGTGRGLRQSYQRPLVTILVLVGLVLLVACVNVANLLLARATAARYDLSLRAALGGSRWRLARLMLAESFVLAGMGALVGPLCAAWGSRALVAQLATADSGISLDLSFDWRVLGFTAAASTLTAMIFGAAPAIRAARAAPVEAIKEKSTTASVHVPGSVRVAITDVLVVVQLALSIVLVVAAGLLVSTFVRMMRAPLGFDGSRVLIATVDTARAHQDDRTRREFVQRLVDAVSAAPGVANAAASTMTPLSPATKSPILNEPGRVISYAVTPEYFKTYGTALRSGREFTRADTAQSQPVAIINEAYVRRFFPDRTALGEMADKRLIVGVATDAVFSSVRGGMRPAVYVPFSQAEIGPPGRTAFSVSIQSSDGRASTAAPAVAAALIHVHSRVTFSFHNLSDDVRETMVIERLVAVLSSFFGAATLVLGGLGLYGVSAYAVERRRREIGIRMALGAVKRDILLMVLGRSLVLSAVGLTLGLAGAALTTRYLSSLLFEVTPLHPATFAAVSALFALVAAMAALVPARRATRVEPLTAMRPE